MNPEDELLAHILTVYCAMKTTPVFKSYRRALIKKISKILQN